MRKALHILALPVVAPLLFLAWVFTYPFEQGEERKGYWTALSEWIDS